MLVRSPATLLMTLLLLVLAASPVRAQTGRTATPRQAPPELHVITLGDSITKGRRTGVTEEQTFAAQIARQLKVRGRRVRVTNVGIGGERTDQALRRLDSIVARKPDLVTIMYGTNDSYVDRGKSESRITRAAYQANLRKIVIELLRRGIQPVLMTEPRWSDQARPNGAGEDPNVRLEKYVQACRAVATEWRLPLVDHFAIWTKARKEGVNLHDWTTDACHPNPAGHARLTRAILPVLRETLGPDLETRRRLDAGRTVRVVCFGDSVTGVYYHTGSRRAYTEMLGFALRRLGGKRVQMTNAGISGNTTADALKRLQSDVLRQKPHLVTVMFGLNDMTRVPIKTYRDNLLEIVKRCRAAGAEVVLATPNNVITTRSRPTEKLIRYCDVVREVARETKSPLCDCYREFDARRAHDRFDWRLLMSDEIHPNMDGHRRIAEQLARTITGRRISLSDGGPTPPALPHTRARLRGGQTIRVLAMPPLDGWVEAAVRKRFENAKVDVTPWPVAGRTLAQIEQDAKKRVRRMKPDVVLIAVPRDAEAASREGFVRSFSWIMNWSLNFGPPTWDVVVVHPAVFAPQEEIADRDVLIGRLVRAQHLPLVDRAPADKAVSAQQLLTDWFDRNLK